MTETLELCDKDFKVANIKINEWETLYHANLSQKKTKVAVLRSDEVDFRAKKSTRDRERYYKMLKESVLPEDIATLYGYVLKAQSCKICEAKLIE